MLANRRGRVVRWAGYLARGLFCLVVFLACAGALYQGVEGSRDRHSNPPPGTFVEVNGLRMHLYCIGQGSPTVILDSGLSDTWLHWYKVQPEVAQFTRVCAYDRAGLGYSDPSPGPRTSRVIAEELHTLLHNAGVNPPLVLAGHSMGGLDSLMYASLYRSEVVGMVLVDSSHPDQLRRLPGGGSSHERVQRQTERVRNLMPFGIPRLLGWCGTALPGRRAEFRAFDCTVRQKQTAIAEQAGFSQSLAQVGETRPLGDIPLIVVSEAPSAAAAKQFLAVWYSMQDELVRRSSRGSRILAPGSSHQIPQDRPDVVIAAIRDVVSQCRPK